MKLEDWLFQISPLLKEEGLSMRDLPQITQSIKKLSDFYIENPYEETPWDESWARVGYLAYNHVLNYMRVQSLVRLGKQVHFFNKLETVIEIGSGTGATAQAISDNMVEKLQSFFFIEKHPKAIELHEQLSPALKPYSDWMNSAEKFWRKTTLLQALVVASYSITEFDTLPDWVFKARAIMIIEPSTSQDGRKLLELRQNLIEKGYHIWAPCTHQKPCPLLNQSKSDWCHHRIGWDQPQWFQEIDEKLPMRNNTLTYSYLLARKDFSPHALRKHTRVIGDLLKEKGKSRQMVCRGEDREFLSWLQRDGAPPLIERGSLVRLPKEFEKKGNELRVPSEEIKFPGPQTFSKLGEMVTV